MSFKLPFGSGVEEFTGKKERQEGSLCPKQEALIL